MARLVCEDCCCWLVWFCDEALIAVEAVVAGLLDSWAIKSGVGMGRWDFIWALLLFTLLKTLKTNFSCRISYLRGKFCCNDSQESNRFLLLNHLVSNYLLYKISYLFNHGRFTTVVLSFLQEDCRKYFENAWTLLTTDNVIWYIRDKLFASTQLKIWDFENYLANSRICVTAILVNNIDYLDACSKICGLIKISLIL